jgi:hypothetical protein
MQLIHNCRVQKWRRLSGVDLSALNLGSNRVILTEAYICGWA